MTCIHPSEEPALGWLVPCLAVADVKTTVDWYAKLDFVPYGGEIENNWAMLRNRAIEIHVFHEHIPKDLLNFRGGDRKAIRAVMAERGLAVDAEPVPGSFIYHDPDGREVFFDSSPEEERAYASGQPLTGPIPEGDVHAGSGLDLGNFTYCMNCADLKATTAFYETLGLVPAGGRPENGWAILARRDHPPEFGKRLVTTWLSLFQGMIPADTLNFRGGNVAEIAATLEARGVALGEGVKTAPDGGESLLVTDPDDHPILFDTTPPERLYAE
jgi:catechol 2,3-dioxygenase-like lactoylglutathione lyase family enzyme